MFGEWWSTVKEVSGGIANQYRRPRCDDDGYPLVKIQGSVALNSESMSTSQANYVAITGGTGYSIGDKITATMWWDTSTPANPAFLTAAFYNWETNLEVSPNMSHLEQTGGDALTITQLQAENLADNVKLDELKALIGEVQASPTTHTLLDRVKSLETAVTGTRTVKSSVTVASGVISTQNLVPAGVATTNSAVEMVLNSESTLSIQTTVTYGALSVQATVNDAVWVTLGGPCLLNKYTGVTSATITAATQGLFSVDCSGFSKIRVTALAAVTGSVTVSLKAVETTSLVALDAPLPAGANAIGSVTIGSGTITTANTQNILNLLVADVASSALTTTTTTATIVPSWGTSYSINIPVTTVSGTNPTLDVIIQESDNTGINWRDVYTFPQITTEGIYRSPLRVLEGNRIRYVQTVGGTTPSFTRAINRLQSNAQAIPLLPTELGAGGGIKVDSSGTALSVIHVMSSGGNIAVTTSAVGTNYTAFASQACKQLTISNNTGTVVELRQDATGEALPIQNGSYFTFYGLTNANQLDCRRTDTSNTQVTVQARWES